MEKSISKNIHKYLNNIKNCFVKTGYAAVVLSGISYTSFAFDFIDFFTHVVYQLPTFAELQSWDIFSRPILNK